MAIAQTQKSLDILEAFWPYLGERRRAKAREVVAQWQKNYHSRPVRFTDEQVEEILAQRYLGVSAIDLAAIYGTYRQYITAIVRGERARNVGDACEIRGGWLTSAVNLVS